MTDQEIKVKIAELCGWTRDERTGPDVWHRRDEGFCLTGDVPSYATSLDAMHEAEKTLDGNKLVWNQQDAYIVHLETITKQGPAERWSGATATARQRAEAFLRVHGAWKEVADV